MAAVDAVLINKSKLASYYLLCLWLDIYCASLIARKKRVLIKESKLQLIQNNTILATL